jgi:hypothetical protein
MRWAVLLFLAACSSSRSATPEKPPARAEPPLPTTALAPELDLPAGWVDRSRGLDDVVFAAMNPEAASTIVIVDLPKQEFGTLASCQRLETLFTLKKHPTHATSELTNTGELPSCTVTLWFETEVETRVIFGTPDHPFDFACNGPNHDDVLADCTSARTSIRFRPRP